MPTSWLTPSSSIRGLLLVALVGCGNPGTREVAPPAAAQENPEGFREECLREPLHRVMGHPQTAVLIERHEPVYSPAARETKIAGVIIVGLAVLSSGEICDAKIDKGLHPAVDACVLEAVLTWRFQPALLQGKPIAVVYAVTVRVDLRDAADKANTRWRRHSKL
ncbi:MAG: energy transducer TonB [Thermoanaerobaculia bacterium]|nr:energy transducer TonB [Thermoanaerobaculia bacterium]MBP9826283.1 energy transducer TonB [Thermoanaerobaculia bacterium]